MDSKGMEKALVGPSWGRDMSAQIWITSDPSLDVLGQRGPLATVRENEVDCGLDIKQLVGVPGYTCFLSALSMRDWEFGASWIVLDATLSLQTGRANRNLWRYLKAEGPRGFGEFLPAGSTAQHHFEPHLPPRGQPHAGHPTSVFLLSQGAGTGRVWGECIQTHTFDELCTSLLQEPMDVVELFGLSGIQHTPISIKNARVSQVRDLSQILGELFPGTWDSIQGRQA